MSITRRTLLGSSLAAGADLVLLEMLQSEDEMREALARIDAPLMFRYVEKKVPALTAQRFGQLGFKIVCYPISSTLAYARLMTRFAAALKLTGTTQARTPKDSARWYQRLIASE